MNKKLRIVKVLPEQYIVEHNQAGTKEANGISKLQMGLLAIKNLETTQQ